MRTTWRETAVEPLLGESSPQPPHKAKAGYIFAAIGAMLFSMKAVLVKLAYLPGDGLNVNDLDAITLMALRIGFALPVYIGILIYSLRKDGAAIPLKYLIQACALGIMGYYFCTFLDFSGLKFITAQLERLLLFTYPVFVVILGALFFGGRITRGGILAIVLAYSGLGIVFIGGDIATGLNVPLGSALLLSAAVLFGLFQLLAKRLIDKIGSKVFTCLAMAGAGTAILTHFTVHSLGQGGIGQALDLPLRIYLIGAAIAFFSTILPSFLINVAMGRIGAQTVAVMGMVGPLATIVAAIVILGEPFAFWDGVGTVVTLSGISLYMWLNQRKPKRDKPLTT